MHEARSARRLRNDMRSFLISVHRRWERDLSPIGVAVVSHHNVRNEASSSCLCFVYTFIEQSSVSAQCASGSHSTDEMTDSCPDLLAACTRQGSSQQRRGRTRSVMSVVYTGKQLIVIGAWTDLDVKVVW